MQIKFITQFLFLCTCSFVHILELYYCWLKIDIRHVDVNIKPWFLIKNGYYIVPSPSTAFKHELYYCWQKIDTELQFVEYKCDLTQCSTVEFDSFKSLAPF